MPGPDLADLISYAQARDGKVILAGDTGQLQAVENGGGMALLAGVLGYARLTESVRFREAWEQQASLRLHDGVFDGAQDSYGGGGKAALGMPMRV